MKHVADVEGCEVGGATVCHSRMLRSQLMLVIKLGLLIATKVGHTILKGSRAKVGDYFLHRYQNAIVGR